MQRITINIDNLQLCIKPSDLRIEFDNDSLSVRASDNVVLFAGYDVAPDAHGDYAEWAEWDGCKFSTDADRHLFQSTVERFIERATA